MTAALKIVEERAPATLPTVIVINVGTPDAPTTPAVRRYLREFLSDPRVLDMAALARWLLLRLVILPFRSPKSAAQYRSVWSPTDGSPLLAHTKALAEKVRARLNAHVVVGMRYGNPSLRDAVDAAHKAGSTRVVLAPMFPQYASASTGTALEKAFALLGALPRVPDVAVVPPFYDDDGFLDSVASTIREALHAHAGVDHVLFSYHGLPLHQVQNIHPATCKGTDACCASIGPDNASCYRAQCLATTRSLVERCRDAAPLSAGAFSTSFQSRLGRAVWLLPNTEDAIDALARNGVKKLAVACPSFVADCLETVEEIGVRARERFHAAGGQELVFIPCVNASDRFADAVADMVKRALGGAA